MTKSQAFWWSRLIFNQAIKKNPNAPLPLYHRKISSPLPNLFRSSSSSSSSGQTHFYSTVPSRSVQDLLAEVEREKQREREQRKRAGLDTRDIDQEDEEDYMRVTPLIEKLEKEKLKTTGDLNSYEEPTDSDSDDDDERFSPDAVKKRFDEFQRKFTRHEELLKNFTQAETLDDAFKWMNKIDKFEQKHFRLRPEYRVIGELMNRLKVAEGKDKFILQHKLNRAMRLVQWKEAYDPNDPANYGVIQEQLEPSVDLLEHAGFEKENKIIRGVDDDNDEEFNDMKEKDDILLEKLNAIDKKLEEKLAELDHTFGKKGKVLEEDIRDLAEERNDLTEKKRRPLYRKGFDVRLIDVNRTCKVTKGGQVVKYTAILVCGNYHGVVGYAKAKGPAVPIALQKAYEKCFQNLHYVERHEEHTIAHAIQTTYKKQRCISGLHPLGRSKVVGSRNPHNTVKAVFKALNAIETPKDVQEKFGRTVVEKYLLS
ncbi:hypothetical protein M0R45_038499 [Rubus argutus]|uniref:S5 DRBM domain-containing protein n=1 Tax=Rubus argutus TaxID=59490 RepID=A0AAW1W5A4_RUBAR